MKKLYNFGKEVLKKHLKEDRPEEGKQYALTGKTGDQCIMNGNSWQESEVKNVCVRCGKEDLKNTICSNCLVKETQ